MALCGHCKSEALRGYLGERAVEYEVLRQIFNLITFTGESKGLVASSSEELEKFKRIIPLSAIGVVIRHLFDKVCWYSVSTAKAMSNIQGTEKSEKRIPTTGGLKVEID